MKLGALIFLLVSTLAIASEPTRQQILAKSIGTKTGVFKNAGTECIFKVIAYPGYEGEYKISFNKPPGLYIATSTRIDERWSVDLARAFVRFSYLPKEIEAEFYFDQNFRVTEYVIPGLDVCRLE